MSDDDTIHLLITSASEERKAQTAAFGEYLDKLGGRLEAKLDSQTRVLAGLAALSLLVICSLAGGKIWLDARPDHVVVGTADAQQGPPTIPADVVSGTSPQR